MWFSIDPVWFTTRAPHAVGHTRGGPTGIELAAAHEALHEVWQALKASPRKRDSYFITSKIPGGLPYANATAALEESLAQLGLGYVDLMLVHFPATWVSDGRHGKDTCWCCCSPLRWRVYGYSSRGWHRVSQ